MPDTSIETLNTFINFSPDKQAYAIYMGIMNLEKRLQSMEDKISCLPIMSIDIEHLKSNGMLVAKIPDMILEIDRLKTISKMISVVGAAAIAGLVSIAIDVLFK